MRCSQLFYPTLREVLTEADVISHQWLLLTRFYSYWIHPGTAPTSLSGPPGYQEDCRDPCARKWTALPGGQEVMMPIVQPAELWQQSGRWDVYGEGDVPPAGSPSEGLLSGAYA